MSGFLDGKTCEKAKLDHADLIRIYAREPLECFVDGEDVGEVALVDLLLGVAERYKERRGTTFLRVPRPRVIHKDATHELSSNRKELRAVLPIGSLLLNEPDVEFVDQRRGIEGVVFPFAAQLFFC